MVVSERVARVLASEGGKKNLVLNRRRRNVFRLLGGYSSSLTASLWAELFS